MDPRTTFRELAPIEVIQFYCDEHKLWAGRAVKLCPVCKQFHQYYITTGSEPLATGSRLLVSARCTDSKEDPVIVITRTEVTQVVP